MAGRGGGDVGGEGGSARYPRSVSLPVPKRIMGENIQYSRHFSPLLHRTDKGSRNKMGLASGLVGLNWADKNTLELVKIIADGYKTTS